MPNKKNKIKLDNNKNKEIEEKSFIQKVMEHEKELVLVAVAFILLVICLFIYFGIILVDNKDKVNIYYDGNLKIEYNIDVNGVSDVVTLNSDNISNSNSFNKADFSFNITNNSSKKEKYRVLLEIDNSMIELDDCKDNLVNYDAIRYSIDNVKTKKLKSIGNDSFLLSTSNIKGSDESNHTLHIWIDKDSMENTSNYHFHGKIVIESIK